MPQVATSPARVSRRTLQTIWWVYFGGVFASGVAIAVIGRPRTETSPVVLAILLTASAMAVFSSLYFTRGLPAAGHPVFDAVGNRFEAAIRSCFVRFVLAGAAAELTGLLGGVLHLFGASFPLSAGLVVLGVVLLVQLRRRAAPLIHYLA